jgi:hypothetical protein
MTLAATNAASTQALTISWLFSAKDCGQSQEREKIDRPEDIPWQDDKLLE